MDALICRPKKTGVGMNQEAEIASLAAENIALQSLVMGLLNSLVTVGNGKLAEGAFFYADMALETCCMQMAARVSGNHSPEALKVLEELRAMLIRAEDGAGR